LSAANRLLLFSVLVSCDSTASTELLELDKVCDVLLPAPLVVSGGAISNRGRIAVWRRHSEQLFHAHRDDTLAKLLALPVGIDIVGGAFVGERRLELFDAARRQVIGINGSGTTQVLADAKVPMEVHAAARLGRGWIVAGRGVKGQAQLAVIGDDSVHVFDVPANLMRRGRRSPAMPSFCEGWMTRQYWLRGRRPRTSWLKLISRVASNGCRRSTTLFCARYPEQAPDGTCGLEWRPFPFRANSSCRRLATSGVIDAW
jgi:hypothetical protein